MRKIISFKDFKKIKEKFNNKKIVLVGGCFDIFHFGHLFFLKKAKQEGDFLIVALESDKFIKKAKKRLPFHNQNQRAVILSYLDMVDLVIKLPFFKSNRDYFQLVKEIKPKIIAVTEGDSKLINKEKQAKKVGGKVKIVCSLIKKFSTSFILNKNL